MDHHFQSQMFRPYMMPNNVRPTSFQSSSFNTLPGMGLAINPTNMLVPLYGESLFNQPKAVESDKASPKLSTQTIASEPQSVVQQGSGKAVNEDSTADSDSITNDIDFESAKQVVSEDVLNAFKSPVMRTAVVTYEPKEKIKRGKSKATATAPKFKFA